MGMSLEKRYTFPTKAEKHMCVSHMDLSKVVEIGILPFISYGKGSNADYKDLYSFFDLYLCV